MHLAWLQQYACREAYKIRLFAIKEYGRVIHEFDPWFNMRATQCAPRALPYHRRHLPSVTSWPRGARARSGRAQ